MPQIKIQNSDGNEVQVTAESIFGLAMTGTKINGALIVDEKNKEQFFEAIVFYLYDKDAQSLALAFKSLMQSTAKAIGRKI